MSDLRAVEQGPFGRLDDGFREIDPVEDFEESMLALAMDHLPLVRPRGTLKRPRQLRIGHFIDAFIHRFGLILFVASANVQQHIDQVGDLIPHSVARHLLQLDGQSLEQP